MFEIGKLYKLEAFIEIVKLKKDRTFNSDGARVYNNYYHVYIENNDKSLLEKDMPVYVGTSPQVDDNEVFPDEVIKMNFWQWLSDENFQDIIDLAYEQKPNATISDFIDCLNYFDNNDDFLDLV